MWIVGADVERGDADLVGIGMGVDLGHATHDDAGEVRGHFLEPFDLEAEVRHHRLELVEVPRREVDEFAHPVQRNLHRYCSEILRSGSKNIRSSGTP